MGKIIFVIFFDILVIVLLFWIVRKTFIHLREREGAIVLSKSDESVIRVEIGPKSCFILPFIQKAIIVSLSYKSTQAEIIDIATNDNLAVDAFTSIGFYFQPQVLPKKLLGELLPILRKMDQEVKKQVEFDIRSNSIQYGAFEIIQEPSIRDVLIERIQTDFNSNISKLGIKVEDFKLLFHPTQSIEKACLDQEMRKQTIDLIRSNDAPTQPLKPIAQAEALTQLLSKKSKVQTDLDLDMEA
jgi:hypothetical protein